MMLGLLPLYPSVPMIGAAPDGAPPRRIGDEKFKKKLPARCAMERPLWWGSFVERMIFMVRM